MAANTRKQNTQPKAPEQAQAATPATENGMAKYRVITDRQPVWNGVRQPENAVITGPRNNEAIRAMLGRDWIREA